MASVREGRPRRALDRLPWSTHAQLKLESAPCLGPDRIYGVYDFTLFRCPPPSLPSTPNHHTLRQLAAFHRTRHHGTLFRARSWNHLPEEFFCSLFFSFFHSLSKISNFLTTPSRTADAVTLKQCRFYSWNPVKTSKLTRKSNRLCCSCILLHTCKLLVRYSLPQRVYCFRFIHLILPFS